MTKFNFDGIGTKWEVNIFNELDEGESAKILALIKKRIMSLIKTIHVFVMILL